MKNVLLTCFCTALAATLFLHPALENDAHAQKSPQANATRKTTRPAPKKQSRTGTLIVITNFEKATVTVNGAPYPSYVPPGEEEGMKLPAGSKHNVLVSFAGNSKQYEVTLNAGERRYLMVELTGYSGTATAGSVPAQPAPAPPPTDEPQEESEEEGRVTVYAKPQGTILIDGRNTGQQTPGTVTADNGSRNIQVIYEDGQTSEEKVVRVRPGSNIRLFFRQN